MVESAMLESRIYDWLSGDSEVVLIQWQVMLCIIRLRALSLVRNI
jgi:hypothetical protein